MYRRSPSPSRTWTGNPSVNGELVLPSAYSAHLRLISHFLPVLSCKELQVHHAEMSLRRSANEDIELSQFEWREASKHLVPVEPE